MVAWWFHFKLAVVVVFFFMPPPIFSSISTWTGRGGAFLVVVRDLRLVGVGGLGE